MVRIIDRVRAVSATKKALRKWPSDYAVAQALGQNEALFLILYKETPQLRLCCTSLVH